jgi:hypothetical protein
MLNSPEKIIQVYLESHFDHSKNLQELLMISAFEFDLRSGQKNTWISRANIETVRVVII